MVRVVSFWKELSVLSSLEHRPWKLIALSIDRDETTEKNLYRKLTEKFQD